MNTIYQPLHDCFQKIVRFYDNDQTYADAKWKEVVDAYSAKGRYYHNLDHIAYMMARALEVQHLIREWDVFVFSIFYHDIVYDTRRNDNEEKSAAQGLLVAANTGWALRLPGRSRSKSSPPKSMNGQTTRTRITLSIKIY